jgi:hypothetical protein
VPFMTRDFALLGATSSAWDCRLIRRPTKILAEILNRASAGLQERAIWSSEKTAALDSTLPLQTDGAGRRVSVGIESCFRF